MRLYSSTCYSSIFWHNSVHYSLSQQVIFCSNICSLQGLPPNGATVEHLIWKSRGFYKHHRKSQAGCDGLGFRVSDFRVWGFGVLGFRSASRSISNACGSAELSDGFHDRFRARVFGLFRKRFDLNPQSFGAGRSQSIQHCKYRLSTSRSFSSSSCFIQGIARDAPRATSGGPATLIRRSVPRLVWDSQVGQC